MTPLPPLDSAADYRKSTWVNASSRSGGWSHRQVDIPYWTAPPGYCRWCGEDLGARCRDGSPDPRRRWHPKCADDYRLISDPQALRRAVWNRNPRCVDCPPDLTPLPFRPQRRTFFPDRFRREVPHNFIGPVDDRTWEADHDVALVDGGSHNLDNVVIRCTPHHAAKTAREAGARAAARRTAAADPGGLW